MAQTKVPRALLDVILGPCGAKAPSRDPRIQRKRWRSHILVFLGPTHRPLPAAGVRDGNVVVPVAQRCRPGRNAATAAAGKRAVNPHFFPGPMNTMPLRGSGLWVPDNPAGIGRCKMAPIAAAGFRGRQRRAPLQASGFRLLASGFWLLPRRPRWPRARGSWDRDGGACPRQHHNTSHGLPAGPLRRAP